MPRILDVAMLGIGNFSPGIQLKMRVYANQKISKTNSVVNHVWYQVRLQEWRTEILLHRICASQDGLGQNTRPVVHGRI